MLRFISTVCDKNIICLFPLHYKVNIKCFKFKFPISQKQQQTGFFERIIFDTDLLYIFEGYLYCNRIQFTKNVRV